MSSIEKKYYAQQIYEHAKQLADVWLEGKKITEDLEKGLDVNLSENNKKCAELEHSLMYYAMHLAGYEFVDSVWKLSN